MKAGKVMPYRERIFISSLEPYKKETHEVGRKHNF
jgi:hypothetical protein